MDERELALNDCNKSIEINPNNHLPFVAKGKRLNNF